MENNNGHDGSRDLVYLAGGAALVVLGLGLIASHPAVRKSLQTALAAVLPDMQTRLGQMSSISAVVPDIQRYLKLRAM